MAHRGGEFKRNRKGEQQPNDTTSEENMDNPSIIFQTFKQFQSELDTVHDKHERLVKLSRDVTIESKRTIFLLHRITSGDKETVLKETSEKLKDIEMKKLKPIALEMAGEDPYRYLRAYSPGLQEYIEAVSFYHYMETGGLISLQDVQMRLHFEVEAEQIIDSNRNATDDEKQSGDTSPHSPEPATVHTPNSVKVFVPPIEYMLGIADLTGEMMRLAIANVSKGNFDTCQQICQFLRSVHDAFLSYGNVSRELNRKMWTLKQSLQKVESACYTLQVRGSEIPKYMLADVINTVAKSSKSFSDEDLSKVT